MFDYFVLAYNLAREALLEGNLKKFFGNQVFRNRTLIPAEMDLLGPAPDPNVPPDLDIHFIEFQLEDLRARKWKFPVASRGIKALRNIKRGFRGFALVQHTTVVGDLWCICRRPNEEQISHPDFKFLDIVCKEREVYAFDTFLGPAYRGKNLAMPFQRFFHRKLKDEGYVKVYGAYYEDNLPALWVHRMLSFKEHPRRRVSRFFFYVKSTLFDSAGGPTSFANITSKGY